MKVLSLFILICVITVIAGISVAQKDSDYVTAGKEARKQKEF
jgi:hypothetical protein